MHLKTLRLTPKSDRPVEEAAAKLRGFFATRFNEYALLHQHIDVDKLLYKYPRIQYKILEINSDKFVLTGSISDRTTRDTMRRHCKNEQIGDGEGICEIIKGR